MRIVIISFLGLLVNICFAQDIPVSSQINKITYNTKVLAVSGDGNAIVFVTDYSESGKYELKISRNNRGWQEGIELPRTIYRYERNYTPGTSLSYDGSTVYFTSDLYSSNRSFDIVSSSYDGSRWSQPQPLGGGVNSAKHDGAPYVTADGNSLFFIRCEVMTNTSCDDCKIMRSENENGSWSEPEEIKITLPSKTVTTPRLFLDGKTMIFSAKSPEEKGGYDFYWSRETYGQWSTPVLLSSINTENDDLAASADWRGIYIYYSKNIGKEIKGYRSVLPSAFQGLKAVKTTLNINRELKQNNMTFAVFDADTGEELIRRRTNEEKITVVLNEGRSYHLVMVPAMIKNGFFAEIIDLKYLDRPDEFEMDVDLTHPGHDVLFVDGLDYNATAPYITDSTGNFLLTMVSRFAKVNENEGLVIEVVQSNYEEDTLSSQHLTEVKYDSVLKVHLVERDSVIQTMVDDQMVSDTLIYTTKVEEWKQRKLYHNDRQEKYVEEIKRYLNSQNVNITNIKIVGVIEPPAESKPDRFLRLYFEKP